MMKPRHGRYSCTSRGAEAWSHLSMQAGAHGDFPGLGCCIGDVAHHAIGACSASCCVPQHFLQSQPNYHLSRRVLENIDNPNTYSCANESIQHAESLTPRSNMESQREKSHTPHW